MTTPVRRRYAQILRSWRETTTVVTALLGWFFVSWALSEVFVAHVVWKMSIGILCLGLVGFKLLWKIVSQGLYVLSQEDESDSSMTTAE